LVDLFEQLSVRSQGIVMFKPTVTENWVSGLELNR
jgi:hypothetical protein